MKADANSADTPRSGAIPIFIVAVGFVLTSANNSARAQDGARLIDQKQCSTCHAIDRRKIGPAFTAIAAKYDGDANAETTIVAKLRDGKGHLRIAASDPEIQAMVRYVLATGPTK